MVVGAPVPDAANAKLTAILASASSVAEENTVNRVLTTVVDEEDASSMSDLDPDLAHFFGPASDAPALAPTAATAPASAKKSKPKSKASAIAIHSVYTRLLEYIKRL
ncbi:hypothetical protein C8R44DRAFT_734760 [Mycena epipterygia]|nr:hypothetical protein C8R44DRAFT_734760 [Mycena epipterygia]